MNCDNPACMNHLRYAVTLYMFCTIEERVIPVRHSFDMTAFVNYMHSLSRHVYCSKACVALIEELSDLGPEEGALLTPETFDAAILTPEADTLLEQQSWWARVKSFLGF